MAELDLEDIEGNYLAIKGTPRYVSGEESQLEWLCEQLIAEVKRLRDKVEEMNQHIQFQQSQIKMMY